MGVLLIAEVFAIDSYNMLFEFIHKTLVNFDLVA